MRPIASIVKQIAPLYGRVPISECDDKNDECDGKNDECDGKNDECDDKNDECDIPIQVGFKRENINFKIHSKKNCLPVAVPNGNNSSDEVGVSFFEISLSMNFSMNNLGKYVLGTNKQNI